MASSHPRIESVALAEGSVKLRFWMDEGKGYHVEWADFFNGPWSTLATYPNQPLPTFMESSDTNVLNNARFYRLVTP